MMSTAETPIDPTPEQEKAAREKEAQEQASLPYQWRQTLVDVDVTVPVPVGTRAKQLEVLLQKRYLKVAIRGQTEAIMEGALMEDIHIDESTWSLGRENPIFHFISLVDNKEIHIHLEKAQTQQWWKAVIQGHPTIDTTKIEPENSKLSDLDGETRAMVEKMMFDQRQKAAGKPTSDDLQKLQMLEKFKAAHPEMDFSQAKFN